MQLSMARLSILDHAIFSMERLPGGEKAEDREADKHTLAGG